MSDSLHSQFKQWLLDAHRSGEIGPRAFRLGDIVLRYLAVSEAVPNPHPKTVEAAEAALREFKQALAEDRRGQAGGSQ